MSRPLDGIVVIEALADDCCLGIRLAVGFAGRIAADMGATVLKIETCQGDPLRGMPPLRGGRSALFAFLNAGKRSIVLSDCAADVAELQRLGRGAQALLGDAWLRSSLAEVLGADVPRDAARAIVQVDMLGRGASADAPASEFTVLALSGLLDLVGDAEREPLRLAGHQPAYAAGLAAYTGLMAGLCSPSTRDGAAEVVRVSLLETALWLNWKNLATVSLGSPPSSRSGQAMAWPVVRCADGWVAIVYQPHEWSRMRELLGDARLCAARFDSQEGRLAHAAELNQLFEACLANRTRAQVSELAVAHRLPIGAILSADELGRDPQYVARHFLNSVKGEDGCMLPIPRAPVLWGGRSFAAGPIPQLAEYGMEELV